MSGLIPQLIWRAKVQWAKVRRHELTSVFLKMPVVALLHKYYIVNLWLLLNTKGCVTKMALGSWHFYMHW